MNGLIENMWLLDAITNNFYILLKCDQSELALVVATMHCIYLCSNGLPAHCQTIIHSHGAANINAEDNRDLVRSFFALFSLFCLGIFHLGGSLQQICGFSALWNLFRPNINFVALVAELANPNLLIICSLLN